MKNAIKIILLPIFAVAIAYGLYVGFIHEKIQDYKGESIEDNREDDEDDIEYQDGQLYAIEYLGYNVDNVENFVPNDLPLFSTVGDEYYKIIPRYDDMSIEIYQLVFDGTQEDFTRRELVYKDSDADSFYIKGNISDIFPNICVVLTTEEGEQAEITPFVSLKDGSIEIGDDGLLIETKE